MHRTDCTVVNKVHLHEVQRDTCNGHPMPVVIIRVLGNTHLVDCHHIFRNTVILGFSTVIDKSVLEGSSKMLDAISILPCLTFRPPEQNGADLYYNTTSQIFLNNLSKIYKLIVNVLWANKKKNPLFTKNSLL